MNHGRLSWLEPNQLDDRQRSLYEDITGGPRASSTRAFSMTDDRGRFHGPFNAMLFEPEVCDAAQRLGAAVRYASRLDPRSREIAILEVARHRRSNFEFYSHRALARTVGLSQEEIASLRGGEPNASFSSPERLVREVVRALCEDRDLTDDLYRRAVEELSEAVVVDLVVLVGFYDYTALSLQVFRVPLPAGVAATYPLSEGGRA